MNIEKLFSGIAVIVDNEIDDASSSIYSIKKLIEEKNIPVLTFSEIPSLDVIPALSGAAFVILDWDYTDGKIAVEEGERIHIPGTLIEAEESRLISFITQLLKELFVPVFIFTAKSKEMVTDRLKDADLWQDNRPNRIFVKQKDEVDTDDELFSAIADWTKEMPSVYVLKEWALAAKKAQNSMFNELYSYSPNWTQIIWNMLKADSRDSQREFGDFITKQLVNRISDYSFEEDMINSDKPVSADELLSVVEGERYIKYTQSQSQAYTGDLYYDFDSNTYYLNIRAQCDLARNDNPILYLIKGKELTDEDIVTEDIKLTSERNLHFSTGSCFSLERLGEICQNEEELISINNRFRAYRNAAFFSNGNIIGKKSEIIITCVAGEKALKFRLDIHKTVKYNQIKDKLIGRVLPPYITQIQQSCANHITREGIMPTPKEIFEKINL